MAEITRQDKWFQLLHLVVRCPNQVNGVRIEGTTRMVLFVLAFHCNGNTDSTYVELDTLLEEVGGTHNPLDTAIRNLKQATLISDTQQHFDAGNRKGGRATRTLNRGLLTLEVARAEKAREATRELKRQKELEVDCRKLLKALEKKTNITCGPILVDELQDRCEYLAEHFPGQLNFETMEDSPDREGRRRAQLKVFKVE